MTDEIYETPSSTPNFQTELAAQLADLIPEAIADGKVDVEKLKELLDGDAADSSERFGLFWPGKKRALRAAQEPTTATLKPDFDNSKDWDTTQNVFIEGDNLEVLKILQKHYHAKIKLIYIDPPYNTGKDFVYPDDYKEGLDTYLEWTRQVNEEGKKVTTNAETEGRYHSNWLNMMYPRLKLARNLLTDDGVIFISIDDNESAHLRRVCDEIFGEDNFVATFVWEKRTNRENRKTVSYRHDTIYCYRKSAVRERALSQLPMTGKALASYGNPDNDPRGAWKSDPATAQAGHATASQFYTLVAPNGKHHELPSGRCWAYTQEAMQQAISEGRIWFGKDGNGVPRIKTYLDAKERGLTPETMLFAAEAGTNESAKNELKRLFGGVAAFETPKPVGLIETLLRIGSEKDSVILDFFSGSGTLGHAVMRLNAEDGGRRRHIQVQLPEPTPDDSEARRAGFASISEVSRERLKLAGNEINGNLENQLAAPDVALDTGFRAYKLSDTNFAKWRLSSDVEEDALQQHLLSLRDSATDDASADELLSEILLKQGYSLSEAISPAEVGGLDVRLVRDRDGDIALLAYLNEHVKPTLEQLRVLVDESPTRIIVLEDAFQGDDELKTNLSQLAKSKGIELWTA
ncbi:site-specific DNA-methyltransferase [uncultured Microbacterium sp.]|uniref:site-specific DNA-methyltransferase n=1 Tax=uncultured Microbacterium sp. TaxID=191216 RepID=UPI0025EA36C6|nr:site-specific DNA-methyltransferase [uncultured Microbacterium sp.]